MTQFNRVFSYFAKEAKVSNVDASLEEISKSLFIACFFVLIQLS